MAACQRCDSRCRLLRAVRKPLPRPTLVEEPLSHPSEVEGGAKRRHETPITHRRLRGGAKRSHETPKASAQLQPIPSQTSARQSRPASTQAWVDSRFSSDSPEPQALFGGLDERSEAFHDGVLSSRVETYAAFSASISRCVCSASTAGEAGQRTFQASSCRSASLREL